jgi:hypothetical protein
MRVKYSWRASSATLIMMLRLMICAFYEKTSARMKTKKAEANSMRRESERSTWVDGYMK